MSFLKKTSKDPSKGIDRALRACQDKLLDVSGPLAKILELSFDALDMGALVDPKVLSEWAQ